MGDLNGMHAPNGGYSFNEYLLNDVATGGLVLMEWQLKTNPFTQMGSNWECDNWVWARTGATPWPGGDPRGILPNPNRILAVRMYQTDWREHFLKTTGDGRWAVDLGKCQLEAARCVEMLQYVQGGKFNPGVVLNLLSDPNVIVWPMNEPDIEPQYVDGLMNSQGWYDLIGEAWLEWASALKTYMGHDLKAKLATSPLAGGHDIPGHAPDEEYAGGAMAEMIHEADILNAHVYGLLNQNEAWGAIGELANWFGLRLWRPQYYKNETEGWTGGIDPGGLFTQYPDKLKIISECGFFRHDIPIWTDVVWENFTALYERAEADGTVVLVNPFIWDSDSIHGNNRICPNEQLRNRFRQMKRYKGADLHAAPITPPPPPPPPPPDNPGFSVGQGVAEAMEKVGDTPASSEVYIGVPGRQLSFTIGASGRLYIAVEEQGWRVAAR